MKIKSIIEILNEANEIYDEYTTQNKGNKDDLKLNHFLNLVLIQNQNEILNGIFTILDKK